MTKPEPELSRERLDRAFAELENSIETHAFTVADAERVLGKSKRTVSLILKGLVEQGLIVRTGRGTYTRRPKPVPDIRPDLLANGSKHLYEALKSTGIEFALSCLDVLSNYTQMALRRYPHFSWVVSGSEDWAAETIEGSGLVPVIEPDKHQIQLALELAGARELAIIRKTANFYAAEAGLASLERALVDIYYEVTRERYPLDTAELVRIIYYAARSVSIDYPRLLRYAGLRRLRKEIAWVLLQLSRGLDIPQSYLDSAAEPNKFSKKLPSLDEAILR